MKVIAAAASLALLAGCASGGHCVGEFDYQKARTLPAPEKVEGISAPEGGTPLRIPPEPAQKTPYAETYENPDKPGKQKVRCLDVPPRLEEPAPPAEPPKPAA